MIMDYIDRGTSNFIGNEKELFMTLNGVIKPIKITVEIYHNIDRIIFSCVIEILNQKEIIFLSDHLGVVVGYSEEAGRVFGIKSLDTCNNVKNYLSMSRSSSGKSQEWVQQIKVKNLVYKINVETMSHRYFTMKIYKLVPIDEKNIESNMKISVTKETRMSDTNIISSGRGTIQTTNNESKFVERIERIYTLKFSDKEFECIKVFWLGFIAFLFASMSKLLDI